jgi:hypothetical protein
MTHRKGETPKIWFRSERVFREDNQWLIHTREGLAVGPYQDKFAADVDAEVLKERLAEAESDAEAREIIEVFMRSDGRELSEIKYTGGELHSADRS